MLNTLHLKTFIAVVDRGNYSAAAEHLHMSQPTVSQHIRALEAELEGARLFRRVGQQMRLTHAGEELVDIAREMLALAQRAEENIRTLRGQVSGHILIGCSASSGERLLPSLLTAFRSHFPAISLAVTLAPADLLVEWLANQQVQLLLIEEQQRRRGWETHLLGSERIVLIAPRGHQLLQQEQVPPGTLRGMPLILPRSGSPLRRAAEEWLRRRGVGAADLQIALETDGTEMALHAVRSGMGMAFIPQTRVPRGRELGVVDLAGLHLQQEWYAIRARERGAPRAVQELFAFLGSREARTLLAKEGLKPPTEA
ncbi:MAG TPA: LysR family transcriptional regulator [Roseiflexaceae bacterium]|nr:LysR family transcriptional regulator [Roseiflexaceae bacterium]HMP40779.1 LysR family transcriptional regulator [Roseiflexaceae bacterium]